MSQLPFPNTGRLAGIDFGTVRIGIAICDELRIVASPHENYTRGTQDADAEYFRRLAASERIVGFVVGLPVHSSGDESQKSKEARRFGQWLQQATDRPVGFYDERFSSAHARQLMAGSEMSGKKRKARLDMVAAQIILASYLESGRSELESPGPLDG